MDKKTNALTKIVLFGILSSYVLYLILFGSTTFADVVRGYEIMFQYSEGGEFNTLSYPHIDKNNYNYFVAWWTPGQWLIPMWLKSAFGINSMLTIQTMVIISCLLTALYGFKKLFESLNFSKDIVYFSLLCIVTNQLFYWHVLMYYGGDLLLLTVFPFFVLFLIQFNHYHPLKKWIGLLILCVLGVFMKNTFLVIMLCGVSFIFFKNVQVKLIERIKQIVPLAVVFIFIYSITYFLFYKHGANPSNSIDVEGYNAINNNFLNDITFALGSPAGILSRLSFFAQKGLPYIHNWKWLLLLLQLIPLLFTIVFVVDYRKFQDTLYHKLIIFFCLPFLLIFVLMFLQDKAVSYEMRHFTPIAFLFFPGFIKWISSFKVKTIVYTLVILVSIIDIGMFAKSAQKINSTHSVWNNLKLPNEDVKILHLISEWDKATDNGLLLVEDYWQLNIGVRKNHKLVFQKQLDKTIVISGMELNEPDTIELNKNLMNNYDEVLLITNKSKNTDFDMDFETVTTFDNFAILKKTRDKIK